ncbi:hypothetical protein [Protofrankia symbiont of Coriaria ruscifolia]|uniref:hypothetical protein n=1 Tax=Protofrankia symbiont of Coriaria ruscifolia TaxID=1306542 RepID=UPI0010416CDA|nr:hypothetical protein [Protofrankia symbiont of Coriaria ruscifolia]
MRDASLSPFDLQRAARLLLLLGLLGCDNPDNPDDPDSPDSPDSPHDGPCTGCRRALHAALTVRPSPHTGKLGEPHQLPGRGVLHRRPARRPRRRGGRRHHDPARRVA